MLLKKSFRDYGPDNVYFNAVFPRPSDTDVLRRPVTVPAEFSETRTVSLLPKCSDYYCSVVRFDIPLDLIPILIMPIVPGTDALGPPPAAPRNITPFIIGIRYNGVTYVQNIPGNNFGITTNYSANIIWTPEDFTVLPVFQTSPKALIPSPWLYMYSYETFIDMINGALAAAYAIFAAANPAAPQAIANVAPFYYYDATTQLISLVAHISWATTLAQHFPDPPGVARICMNYELNLYLDAFHSMVVPPGIFPLIPANNINVFIEDLHWNGFPVNTYPAVPTYVKVTQAYNNITYWNSLRRLVITTNTIPIVQESVPVGDRNTGAAATLPIISDFIPQLTTAGDSRTIAYYIPTGQYRLADMIQDQPLQKIDLKLFWSDKDGNLYPIMISQFQQANVKLGFFKKTLYKNIVDS